MQLTTFSPSSSRSRRSTPCVLGCCGPMFSSIVSPVSARGETNPLSSSTVPCQVSSTGLSINVLLDAMPHLLFRKRLELVDLLEIEGELNRLVAKRVIFTLWMTFPIFGHQDASQIR